MDLIISVPEFTYILFKSSKVDKLLVFESLTQSGDP